MPFAVGEVAEGGGDYVVIDSEYPWSILEDYFAVVALNCGVRDIWESPETCIGKGSRAKFLETVGEVEIAKPETAGKGMVCDDFEMFQLRDFPQRFAAGKSFFPYYLNRIRKNNLFERLAVAEGAATDYSDSVGKANVCQMN